NEEVLDLRLWDAVTGKEVRKYRQYEQTGESHSLAFSPDGRLLVVASSEGTVSVLDAGSGRDVHHVAINGGLSATIVFSPDGRTFALGLGLQEQPGRVELRETISGKLRREIRLPSGEATALTFAPDGKTLVTGLSDTTALVWDLTRDPQAGVAPTPER